MVWDRDWDRLFVDFVLKLFEEAVEESCNLLAELSLDIVLLHWVESDALSESKCAEFHHSCAEGTVADAAVVLFDEFLGWAPSSEVLA